MRYLTTLTLLILATCLGSCASKSQSRSERVSDDAMVTLSQASSGAKFVLVSATEEERIRQSSEIAESANRKFQTPEVMGAVLDRLDELGFAELSLPGQAPAVLGEGSLICIEAVEEGRAQHVIVGTWSSASDREHVWAMFRDVVDLWNDTGGLQTVEARPGEEVFKQPGPRPR